MRRVDEILTAVSTGLFHAYFGKKPRRSGATAAFFAFISHKKILRRSARADLSTRPYGRGFLIPLNAGIYKRSGWAEPYKAETAVRLRKLFVFKRYG
jgi:hypothetical protein